MATVGGIDATFGPCIAEGPDYTPETPGQRYVSPAEYMKLVRLNAQVGMETVVYDARMWSTNAAVRDVALAFWAPEFGNIAAWDLGDEFDPNGPAWPTLIERWGIVLDDATVRSGIRPFTNTLPFASALNRQLSDVR